MDKRLFEKKHFLWRMLTFSGYIPAHVFWSEMFLRLVSFFCAVLVLCIVVTVAVPGDTQQILDIVYTLIPILGILWLIPMIVLTRRRLRDAGYSAKSYLWLLLPVAGWIIFIVRLCGRSVRRKPEEIWLEYD